jgi:hypothetical protein
LQRYSKGVSGCSAASYEFFYILLDEDADSSDLLFVAPMKTICFLKNRFLLRVSYLLAARRKGFWATRHRGPEMASNG